MLSLDLVHVDLRQVDGLVELAPFELQLHALLVGRDEVGGHLAYRLDDCADAQEIHVATPARVLLIQPSRNFCCVRSRVTMSR